MWKNRKIGAKLLMGFGLLLLVFVVSVLMTRRYVSVVEEGSAMLNKKVVPSLELATSLEAQAYELFLAVRDVQYTETQDAVSHFKEEFAKYTKIQDDILALNRAEPSLIAPAHTAQKIVPIMKEYADVLNRTVPLISKKQTLFDAIVKAGEDMSSAASDIVTELHTAAQNSVGANDGRAALLVDSQEKAARLLEDAMSLRRIILRAMIAGDLNGMRGSMDALKSMQKKAEPLKPVLVSPEGQRTMTHLTDSFSSYESNLNNFVTTFIELDSLNKARAPLMQAFNAETTVAGNSAVTRVKEVTAGSVEDLNYAVLVMFLSTAAAVVLGVMIAVFIARSISKPLNTIVNLAQRVGEGDLTVTKEDFQYEGHDEMGNMVTALTDMVQAQGNTMKQIVNIAGDLSSGAGNLSAISEETNAAMEEIKASISQVSTLSETNGTALEESNAGVEEMSAGADTVAQSATDSAAFIAQTTDASNKAIQTMHNVIEGMRDVDKNAKESELKTRQLVSSVDNVSSFVSVITGIADQTNLLALNAAIEAARAGEVGRGFAVVAEEVRKLAEESARAAQNVNGIIQELQSGAHESIKATTTAGRLLAETLEHAESALTELNGALQEMHKANDSIQNIAAVAEEQAASSKEVALAIDSATKSSMEVVETVAGIHRSTNETTQATQGVAMQAETMTEYAKSLMELLARFKLSDNQSSKKMLKGK